MKRVDMRLQVRHNISELVYDDPADSDYDATKSGNFWKDSFINDMLNEGIKKFSREERWDWLWQVQTNISVPANTATILLQPDIEVGRHAHLTLWQAAIWNSATAYVVNNKVFYNGNIWRAKAGSTNVTPVEGATWTYDTSIAPIPVAKVSPGEGIALRNNRLYVPGEPEVWFAAKTQTDTLSGDKRRQYIVSFAPPPKLAYAGELYYIGNITTMAADTDEPDIPEDYQPAVIAWATMRCWLKEKDSGKASEQLSIYEQFLTDARAELKNQGAGESIQWGRPPVNRSLTNRDWYARHIPQNLG